MGSHFLDIKLYYSERKTVINHCRLIPFFYSQKVHIYHRSGKRAIAEVANEQSQKWQTRFDLKSQTSLITTTTFWIFHSLIKDEKWRYLNESRECFIWPPQCYLLDFSSRPWNSIAWICYCVNTKVRASSIENAPLLELLNIKTNDFWY